VRAAGAVGDGISASGKGAFGASCAQVVVRGELRWLGSRESRLVREVRRHLRPHPPAFDELGFLVDQPPLTMAEQLRPARDRLRRVHSV